MVKIMVFDIDNLPASNYFYGFMITVDNKIIEEYNGKQETNNGCYFLIKKENNKITISQDYFGCFGCYVYQEKDYFAISNNLLELVKHLKDKLSLNKEYYNRLINARETAFSLNDTVINEIKRYNGDYIITIIDNKITITKKKESVYSINYNDKRYLHILDKWYEKWINVFRNIKGNIVQDLSGGIDTRILLSISKNANILNSISFRNKNINYNIDGLESIEDSTIGQQIIKHYNLQELNKVLINKKINYENNFICGNSNFTGSIREKPIQKLYRICGNGGLLYHRPNTFNNLLKVRFYNVDDKLINDYNEYYDSVEIPSYLHPELKDLYIYRKLLVELRDGIKSADYYRNNTILLCPMMDPDLNMLNPNYNGCSVLPILILKRYCKELLNFPIEGISEKNINLGFEFDNEKIFNYNEIKKEIKPITFFHMKKSDYEKNFSLKSIKDSSHSTGSCPGQIENILRILYDKKL